jgi:hypothetical protein
MLHRCRLKWPFLNMTHQWQPSARRAISQEVQLSMVHDWPTISGLPYPVISSKARLTEMTRPSGFTTITPSWIVSTTDFQ